MPQAILTAHSDTADTVVAVADTHAALAGQAVEFDLLLHGPNHSGCSLEQALADCDGSQVYGCSTVGEILPTGYRENSLSRISFSQEYFTCEARSIEGLGEFGFRQAGQLVSEMKSALEQRAPAATAASTFALLLIDSTSQAEEFVAAALGSELGNIELIGGSAGDNWQLSRAPVLFQGHQLDDSAVLLLVHTILPFRHYSFHNYVPTDKRGVITSATATQRLVHEINGAPALQEYARLLEMPVEALDRDVMALHPAIITIGDRAYPRGFSEILEDGSLRSACAIDEGVVFRVAAQVDFVQQMSSALEQINTDLGDSLLVLALECAARRQTIEQNDLQAQVALLFERYNVWGLNCMGEQSNSLNMNNSFNCLAFALPA